MSESESPHKWSRKRPAEDDLEDISREEVSWKVKTLDEILQEKRKRLAEENTGNEEQEKEEEHEISRPESRESSGAASPGSVKRGRNASSSPVELPSAEVIYQLSPSQNSYSSSSSEGMTPSNIKLLPHQLSKDKLQHKQKRRQTEEEEGEIVSDGSDHEGEEKSKSKESRKANVNEVKEQQSTEGEREKINSPNNSDDNDDDASESESEEEKFVPSDEKTTQKMVQNKDEQDVESEDSDESDSESGDDSEAKSSNDDVVTETVKDKKEKAVYKDKKRDVSIMKQNDDDEVEDDTDVSADENDNDEDNDEDDDDEDDDDNDDDDDDGSEEESDSDDDSTEESESESESENEQVTEQHPVKKARRIGVQGHDDEELEDLHKELLQATESQRKKEEEKKRERYDLERSGRDRSYKNDDHRQRSKDYTHSSDDRKHYDRRKRKAEEQELKNYFPREKSYEKRESRLKEKSNERSSSVRKVVENSYSKEAVGLRELQKEKYHTSSREVSSKSSKRDIGKSKRKSPREIDSSRKDTKSLEKLGKESKDSGDYRREPREERRRKQYEKQKDAEKSSKSAKAAVSKDLRSSILTEQERKQFSQEVVDFDSDGGSSTEENAHGPLARKNHHNDVEMLSDKDDDKEPETPKLPLYLPAIKGCRNVEEFQWLNRIEEGTYGVVYRAKDKRTSEIVALKRLKMEKEKEGFPITSLREINTLLKAQHPNIVTVREIVVGSNMDKIYIVMDYVEHDLKALMEHMPNSFLAGEVKTLMIQLLRAVAHLHDNWILHRDLKTSNLLLSNKGILKVGDFGLAREYGSPLRNYTPIVVTLWYRAPELLLGVKEYSTPIDLWSVGCIFAELLTMKPLFPGSSEIDQINKIFKELGTPSDRIWPGPPSYSELPAVKKMNFTEYPYNNLRNKFGAHLTDKGFDLLNRFLTYDPKKRVTAEQALEHGFFDESPLPVDPAMFPSWPAKSELVKGPKRKNYEHSPRAPEGGAAFSKLGDDDSGGFHIATLKKGSKAVAGFSLKF